MPVYATNCRPTCRKNPFLRKNRQLSTDKTDKNRHGFGLKSILKTVGTVLVHSSYC
ncbi:MAG: ATP-binding protein [Lachnospiraceae bacterium]|nr:ATP-binding protein [Lachnospiraceae bacterium]